MNIDVGQLIKKARLEKGYTQEELAELVGVKKSAVAKWETGRVSEIKRSNLKKISEALSIDAPLLLGEEPEVIARKPTTTQDDGLTESHRKLIEFAKTVPEDRAEWVLSVMKKILENG